MGVLKDKRGRGGQGILVGVVAVAEWELSPSALLRYQPVGWRPLGKVRALILVSRRLDRSASSHHTRCSETHLHRVALASIAGTVARARVTGKGAPALVSNGYSAETYVGWTRLSRAVPSDSFRRLTLSALLRLACCPSLLSRTPAPLYSGADLSSGDTITCRRRVKGVFWQNCLICITPPKA